jgi:hypothetical protein
MASLDSGFEKEHRLQFRASTTAGDEPLVHVVFSGSVGEFLLVVGGDDDDIDRVQDVELIVGPSWSAGSVRQVVPYVSIGRFHNSNADEDDEQAWEIRDLTWDTVPGPAAATEERIRLKFILTFRGVASMVSRFNYYVTASGLQLGQRGLDFP